MKRTPLLRKTPLRRRGPRYAKVHARTVAARHERREANHERAYGSEERKAWLWRQPCCVSGERPVEIAHVESGGMSRKSDAELTVPLTAALHRELHDKGRSTFEWKYGVNLREAAHRTERKWQAERARRGEA